MRKVQKITKQCIVCKINFESYPSSPKKYCSLKCYHLSRIGKTSNKGYKHTQEDKDKISKASKKFWKTHKEEMRKKISDVRKGMKFTETHKNNLRKFGEQNHNYGKHFSEETKAKIRLSNKNRVIKDGSIEILKDRLAKARKHIKQKKCNTLPERIMQVALKKNNIEFETQKTILGTPDIFIKNNICIFCDGNYWHNYPHLRDSDKKINATLISQGYKVLRFWESDIKKNIDNCINIIKKEL